MWYHTRIFGDWLSLGQKTNLLLAGICCAFSGFAGVVATPYEIGTWQGFRSAAVSYTFDDDLPNQYAVAVPMFNAKGFKLTLFTVTTWIPGNSWSPVKTAASFGHEIASHTVTHPYLNALSTAQQTNELANSQTTINANITNQTCLTLAYPYCVPASSDAITARYYIAARVCSGTIELKTPRNFWNISSIICGTQGSVHTTQDFITTLNNANSAKGWCVYLIHAIDNDNGYSPLSSAVLQGSLNFISTNSSKFWVETFGNVVRYIRERDASAVTVVSNSDQRFVIQVTNNLAPAIYDFPITLRRPLPTNWLAATVSQNNKSIDAAVVAVGSTNYLMFDVVPNGGDITIAQVAPPTITLTPLALECADGMATGTVQAEIQDSSGQPIQVVWTVDGVPAQTNNIPSGGVLTTSQVGLTGEFSLGEHVVNVSASNGVVSPATASTTVTVADTTPPVVLAMAASPAMLWPPNHLMMPVNVSVQAIDECDPAPVATITQVLCNQPGNPLAPDWEITGPLAVNLRAERAGNGGDRVYTIFVEVADASRNKTVNTIVVTVPHSQSVRGIRAGAP